QVGQMQQSCVGEHEPRIEDVRGLDVVIQHTEQDGSIEFEHEMADKSNAGRLSASMEPGRNQAQRSRLGRDLRRSVFSADLEARTNLFQRSRQYRSMRSEVDGEALIAAYVTDSGADASPRSLRLSE